MKKIIMFFLVFILLMFAGTTAISTTCFYRGEQVSGLYKICYYSCLGSTVAITVRATQLCPLTINQ